MKNVSVKDLFLKHCLHFVLSTKYPPSFIVEIETHIRSNINKPAFKNRRNERSQNTVLLASTQAAI